MDCENTEKRTIDAAHISEFINKESNAFISEI
ncbi:MAG: hypothetical protein ACI849_000873 [Patiriisocius sp.]|jgi:hypothetical protein